MTDFISATLGNDIVEAGVTVAEEQEIVARSVGDSDDDSLGLTDLENSIREVAEMEGKFNTFFSNNLSLSYFTNSYSKHL